MSDTPATHTKPRANGLMERSIHLSFDFATLILQDPSISDDIPNGVTLVLIPNDDPELAATKIARGMEAIHRGEDVYFRHFQRAPTHDAGEATKSLFQNRLAGRRASAQPPAIGPSRRRLSPAGVGRP